MLERIRRADDHVIAEQHAHALLEALDKEELQKATKILNKLATIKKAADADPGLAVLSIAIKDAAEDVNDYTGGGIGALMKKGSAALMKKFGLEKASSNPILKSLTLLSALETGLEQLETIVKNNVSDYDFSKGSLDDQIGDDPKNNKVKENLKKTIAKAFRPEGAYSKIASLFSGGGGIPYLKDVKLLITGIMDAKGESLQNLIAAAKQGPSSEEAAAAAKDITQQAQGGQEAAAGQPGAGKEQTVTADNLAAAVAAGNPGNKELADAKPKEAAKQLVDDIAGKTKLSNEIVGSILSALIKANKLKANFSTQNESRNPRLATLSLSDVHRAKVLYLESGGSSRKWLKLLSEATFDGVQSGPLTDKLFPGLNREKRRKRKTELENAIKSAGGTEASSQDDTNKAGIEKHQKVIDAIIGDLKDVAPEQIAAVLEALPSYFIAEAARRRKILESRKLQSHRRV